jgi:hypothetical protein
MKCLECGHRSKKTSNKNWQLFQMCINCATRNHPEEYDHIITRKRQEPTKVFAVCDKCGQRCSILKGYQRLKHKKVGVTFCFDCKFLKINDKEITVEQ